MKRLVIFLMLLTAANLHAQKLFLVCGTYTRTNESKGIYVYSFDATNAETKLLSKTYTEDPSYLAFDRSGNQLYVVNELRDEKGSVSSFSFDKKTGRLKLLNRQSSGGGEPCYISIDAGNKWVAVANYGGGSLSALRIQPDGTLSAPAQTIRQSGSGPNKERQESAHVHSTVFAPDGHFLAATDLGTDQLALYPFNAGQQQPLTDDPHMIAEVAGSGPRHILFSRSTSFAYLIEELSGNIVAYRYNNGKLDSMQTISSHPEGYSGELGSAAIHFSPDGKFLYASNRGGSNTISIFSVDGASGRLASVGFQSTGGDHPRDFTIDPTGKFLLVGNKNSGNIVIFKRNAHTGLLTDTGKRISIPQPTQLVFTGMR